MCDNRSLFASRFKDEFRGRRDARKLDAKMQRPKKAVTICDARIVCDRRIALRA